MESAKKKYIKPEILIHEYQVEKGYAPSSQMPADMLLNDLENLGTFEEGGATHWVSGRCTRSNGADKGWY